MSGTPNHDQHIAQLIDANLDRAREGIRVIEDWCRFGLNRKDLVITLKNWRQELGASHKENYKKARSIHTDSGAKLDHPFQKNRVQPLEVVFANCARAQEALRVLEEFSRGSNQQLSKISSRIRYGLYEIEKEILKASCKSRRKDLLHKSKLCLVTTPHPNLINTVYCAVKAGIKMVQYRSKKENDLDKVAQAKELVAICRKSNSLFIVNDRIDLALAVDADGVHLGQEDFPLDDAKRVLGEEKILGVSTHSIEQVQQAESQGWDYIGIGPIFKSRSKPMTKPIGLKTLKEVSSTTRLPYFAIGGINEINIREVLANGATRVAVINAIMNAKDAGNASRNLLKELQ